MELAKLQITPEVKRGVWGDPIKVLFNPNQITMQKSVNWRPMPTVQRDVVDAQFTHGDRATLSMDLFFDTYAKQQNVEDYTRQIMALATVELHGDLHRPPLCRLQWGKYTFNDSYWVLESLNQRFTLFLPNGTPARATLSCSFKEWRSADDDQRRQNTSSADVTRHRVVQLGDRLSTIAAQEYGDPSLWREIAMASGIDNPRTIKPGDALTIPALRTGRGGR